MEKGRRDFLKRAGLLPSALALSDLLASCRAGEGERGHASSPSAERTGGLKKGRVFLGKRNSGRWGKEPEAGEMEELLLSGIRSISSSSPEYFLKSLFSPEDVIGIKMNCLASPPLAPRPATLYGLIRLLTRNGVPEGNILVWERSTRELKRAGFPVKTGRGGVRSFGLDMLEEAYDPNPTSVGSIGSCFARTVSGICNVHISLTVMKDHDLAGVSGAMKNFFGAIHNPNKYHDNSCSPYLADLFLSKGLKGKVLLNVCDALTAQYEGGPSYKPAFEWRFEGLFLSTDMVALDTIMADLIEEKRREKGLPSLREAKRPPLYLKEAEKRGIGIHDREKIEIVERA